GLRATSAPSTPAASPWPRGGRRLRLHDRDVGARRSFSTELPDEFATSRSARTKYLLAPSIQPHPPEDLRRDRARDPPWRAIIRGRGAIRVVGHENVVAVSSGDVSDEPPHAADRSAVPPADRARAGLAVERPPRRRRCDERDLLRHVICMLRHRKIFT